MSEAISDLNNIEMIKITARGMLQLGHNDRDILFNLRKIPSYTEADIKEALRQLRAAEEPSTATTSIRDKKQYYGWYSGPKQESNFHWPALKEQLLTKDDAWTTEMVDSLDRSSTMVVSHIAPPKSKNPVTVKGLVLGHIQSGKTANFSATIAKGVDEGYKLIIVLAGMHNNLRKQTENRLRSELVKPLNGTTCTTLTDVDEKGDFKRKQTVSANRQLSLGDGFVLVVLKKNSTVLRNFNRWLEDASDSIIESCPTLIIDDESDQASINTSKADQDPTAINSLIRSLIERFHVVSYVGYTATPFANVFIDASVEDDIYPSDFLVTLEKPQTYYGPEELFGRNEVNGRSSTDGFPVLRTISDDDATALRKMAKGKSGLDKLPESMEQAINSFIIGSSIRLCRGQWKSHMTMLIHISHLTDSHSRVREMVEDYLEELKEDIKDNVSSVRSIFEKIWSRDFSETTKNIVGSCDHEFEKVWKNCGKFTEFLEIIMDNSNSTERLSFDRSQREGEPLWAVVVGGNTLSRGLTLEGLTTSYFVRNSKAYDTLLQMGRWFGYRKNYVDLTRIYVPDELYQNFYELATIEQEIRDEIGLMAANEERPIDVALRIRKIPNMLITSSNKSRSTKMTFMSYSGTKVQTHQIIAHNRKIVDANYKVVEKLLSSCSQHHPKQNSKLSDLSACHLFLGIPNETILQFLDTYKVAESNSKFNIKMLQDYIAEQNSIGLLANWSVALMSLKSGNPIKIGGYSTVPVTRRVKHEAISSSGEIESTLRAVSTPGEELIDLEDQFSVEYSSTDKIMQPSNGPKISDVNARYKFRPTNRGLLLIYPLASDDSITDEEFKILKNETNSTFPLRTSGQVFAVSLVFPYSEKRTGTHLYMQNKSV